MKFSRIVWLAGGAALLAAWLAAATATRPGRSQPGVRESAPPAAVPDSIVAELQAQVERLKERQLAVEVPERTVRNPFELGRRIAPTEIAVPNAEEPAARAGESPPPAPAGFPYTLAGIGESKTADAIVRTAIVSGIDGVRLLKVGDDLAGRYHVVAIEPRAVELDDRETGERRRLSLP